MNNFFEAILYPKSLFSKHRLERTLAGKTVLITGASSGIGEQLAYLLASSKVHLVLVARREERLLAIKAKIKLQAARVTVYKADLRNEDELGAFLQFLHQLPGGIDIVVNNAGHSIRRSIFKSLDRYHDFSRTMAINYSAPVQMLLSIIPLLKQRQGHIINVSSINVLLYPFPEWAAYQASKAAFNTWFVSVAPELNSAGIRTTSIYLPLVRTPMILPTLAYEKMPAMSPQHVANIIARSIYTKQTIYKPWWTMFAQLASLLFRQLITLSLRRLYKRRNSQ